MPRVHSSKTAFTLIEVMVAVMIVSVVIAALLQMRGNTSHQFFGIKKSLKTDQYSSFLLALKGKYGFEESRMDMSRLVEDFDLESDLRRKLKAIKVEVDYDVLETIDTSEFDEVVENEEDATTESGNSGIVFELGKTTMKTKEFTNSLIRIQIQ